MVLLVTTCLTAYELLCTASVSHDLAGARGEDGLLLLGHPNQNPAEVRLSVEAT